MDSRYQILAIAGAYLVACLILGMVPGRKSSSGAAGYVAGDRSLGIILMYFITGATIFSSFAFLGGPGWAYSRGAAAFYILGYGVLGMVPFYFLGPRAARVAREYGFVTQAEMVSHRYGSPAVAGLMAVVSVVAFVPYLALQMKGAGYVLSAVTEGRVPDWAGAALVYGVVLIYVLRSGVLGVGWTNTFQGIFMMVMAWGLGLYLPAKLYGGVPEMFRQIADARPELLVAPGLDSAGAPWSWGEFTSAILVSIIGFSAWPHLFMKAFTARSDRIIRRTVLLYPTFQIFLVPLFFIGFAGVLYPGSPERPDEILLYMILDMRIPAVVVGLFCAGALAASMSSGDAMVHAAASVAVRDGWVAALGRQLSPNREKTAIRWMVVVVIGLAYGVAISYQGSLVALLLSAYGAVVQFMPALVAALYIRRSTGQGVVAGIVAGSLVTLLFVLYKDMRPWPIHAGLYGLAANVAAMWVVSRLTRGTGPKGEAAFLRIASE
ncbi:MAG: sodium:solute symporter family protein [Acidobacteria bacterium]|uniref:Sodium:solute symporter family protein n=1 Tax=Candidatus Polarisedimenticola svalbardensis TaxID=2886004 RepID=A0A8J6Y0Q0_9BACT|nr:sodium:solute symporter family protein [Candidatus Polarisedimenticola svalbardensis]